VVDGEGPRPSASAKELGAGETDRACFPQNLTFTRWRHQWSDEFAARRMKRQRHGVDAERLVRQFGRACGAISPWQGRRPSPAKSFDDAEDHRPFDYRRKRSEGSWALAGDPKKKKKRPSDCLATMGYFHAGLMGEAHGSFIPLLNASSLNESWGRCPRQGGAEGS